MNVKEQYLTELHGLLKSLINLFVNKYEGEHTFVNSFLISGCYGEYGCAENETADSAIFACRTFNEYIPKQIELEFIHLFLDADLEVSYIFGFIDPTGNWPDEITFTLKKSQNKILLDQSADQLFDKVFSAADLEMKLKIVQQQISFGLVRRS